MKIESNKNWTTCLRLNTGDGSPRVFLLNSHFLGSVPRNSAQFFSNCVQKVDISKELIRIVLVNSFFSVLSMFLPLKREDIRKQKEILRSIFSL